MQLNKQGIEISLEEPTSRNDEGQNELGNERQCMGRGTTGKKTVAESSSQKSTGPRTQDGKRRSKLNALKHRLFSKSTLLKSESRSEYNELLNGLKYDFQPEGVSENVLVEYLAVNLWRKRRLLEVELQESSKDDILAAKFTMMIASQDLNHVGNPDYVDKTYGDGNKNLLLIGDYIKRLERVRLSILIGSRDRNSDLARAFRQSASDPKNRERTIDTVVETSRLAAEYMKENENSDGSHRMDETTCLAIDEEINRLKSLYVLALEFESQKLDHNVNVSRIPSADVSDRLIRYEAHLSREFDRTLTQLERLQRSRRGQSILPPIKVDISS
jgi:hypothetical protein